MRLPFIWFVNTFGALNLTMRLARGNLFRLKLEQGWSRKNFAKLTMW